MAIAMRLAYSTFIVSKWSCPAITYCHCAVRKSRNFQERSLLSFVRVRQGKVSRFFFFSSSRGQSEYVRFRIRAESTRGSPSEESLFTTATTSKQRSEVDELVDGMSFGELCNDFECISSPSVEATARQLAKDILDLREGNRALGHFSVFVKYKDPLRTFTGREKYKRPSWIKVALDSPTTVVRRMEMLSTSVLNIQWAVSGRAKFPASLLCGEVILAVTSTFIMNQISGQVVTHEDQWDLSGSSPMAQAYFWVTRLAYSTVEAGKDAADIPRSISKLLDSGKDEDKSTFYVDPTGDPRKFFQVEDNPQRDLFQIGLVIALIYLLVQFLKLTL
ncbi:hypothetical protein O6H91_12G044500 [Diphasiastrum complanatum]|uniref:Uncharacterized protein n=1 Tax=Diphasiastrum complanatum TaxID=34168 RepID=A0ACC2C1Q0_DIPCM|nr:hypothetical protein O6H91_12G044500 [Diphasiastrum complanatum]